MFMTEDPNNGIKPLEHSIFVRISNVILALWEKIQNTWFRWAKLNQHAAWFPFFVGSVVAVDSMIVILPGDVVVALAVLSNPGKWKRLAVYSGLGSLLGAFCLYLVLHNFGKSPLDQLSSLGVTTSFEELNAMSATSPDLEAGLAVVGSTPPKWDLARAFFDKYGLYSLALGSLVPFMSWPPVVMAGLSTDNWGAVFLLLLLGRLARYFLFCFGVREGWAMFQTLREQAKEKKEAREHEHEHAP